MPQLAVPAPLREGNLADELGLNPVHRRIGLRPFLERAGSLDQALKEGAQISEGAFRESHSDMGNVNQLAVVVDPRTREPKPVQRPLGSVKPPLTASRRRCVLIFSQDRLGTPSW
jgi:hypothetical protein